MYKILEINEMPYRLEKGENGEPVLLIGMYEQEGRIHNITLRLKDFPMYRESIDTINNITINCPEQ